MLAELIAATCVVLFISCLCSLLEAVLYSLPVSQIEMMASENRTSGKILQQLHADIQRPISAILSLNTLANTGGAAIAGAAFVGAFGKTYEVYFTGGLALAVLLFSEVIPKTAGVVYARSLGPFIARPIQLIVWLFAPLIWLNRFATRLITRDSGAIQDISAEEIEVIARMSRQAGAIDLEQERVISNILKLHHLRARDIMTPRTVVFSLDRNATLVEAREEAGNWPHTRVPLYDGDRENVTGQVFRRDVYSALVDGRKAVKLADLERPIHTVPEAARANQLLQNFLQRREHLFALIDEYGVFSGIISLEDVIEEIVGEEIVDESDRTVDMQERARSRSRHITDSSAEE